MQIKKTGSSDLEKKERRYMADMDCGGCRHLPAGDAGHEDSGCAHYEGKEQPDPFRNRDGQGMEELHCKEGGHRLNRERRDLLTACRIYGLDSERLHRRAKMMLGFRHKREAYKGMYGRKERMAGRGRMAQELRKALYCIHNLEVEDMEALTGAFAVLSGSGMLDDIIEEAIDTAVSRFVVGEKYYRPILDMRYDGHGGDLWMVIEKRINIEHSQTAERHKVAGGFILFLVALCVIHMCSRILTLTSIMLIAGVFIIPRFANICYGYGISTVWCSGVLFICTVFGLISSISNDVEVVLGTSRAGEGATVLMVMVLILLFSSIFAMNGLRDANLGFFAFLVLIISIPWCLLNVLTEVPNTNAMKLLSIVILFIIAIIDQILTTSKR